MSEKMRESFIKWYSEQSQYGRAHEDELWMAWQASRAALVVELPSLENCLIHPFDGSSMIVDAVANQLDAAGVACK